MVFSARVLYLYKWTVFEPSGSSLSITPFDCSKMRWPKPSCRIQLLLCIWMWREVQRFSVGLPSLFFFFFFFVFNYSPTRYASDSILSAFLLITTRSVGTQTYFMPVFSPNAGWVLLANIWMNGITYFLLLFGSAFGLLYFFFLQYFLLLCVDLIVWHRHFWCFLFDAHSDVGQISDGYNWDRVWIEFGTYKWVFFSSLG